MIEKGFTEPTDRVKRLKKVIVEARPMVETYRAQLVTETYKETEGMTPIMRRAKLNENLFNNLPIVIRDDELIVGSPCVHPRSSDVGVEYSYADLANELETMQTRTCDQFDISEEDKEVVRHFDDYWKGRTMSDYAWSLMSPECKSCQEHAVFNAGNYMYAGVGHVCCNYEKVLKIGFEGVIKEVLEAMAKVDNKKPEAIKQLQFYKALLITYTAAINYAHRYGKLAEEMASKETNPQRRSELMQISRNCYKVPEHPAETFWEALQSFWFVHNLINLETNAHSYSPGPFDRYMNPYFVNDKTITKDFAQELLDCLFVKFNDKNKVRDDISAQAFAGYQMFELIGLGGTDEDGNDLTNEMSYMCLDALAHVGMPMPSVGSRIGPQTPDEFLYRNIEVIRLGYGMPNLFNDEVIIPAMVNRGIPLKVARTYNPSGCVEPDIAHKYDGWHDACAFNVAKVMDITLNNGRAFGDQVGPKTGEITDFHCIEDFFQAFEKQMEFFVRNMIEADNCIDTAHGDLVPLPFESGLIDGCIEKGKSVQEGGAIWNFSGPQGVGIIDAGDSLYCIQKNVFEDKKFTLAELKEALENNFGYPVPAIGSQPISVSVGDPKYSVGNMSIDSINLVNKPKEEGGGSYVGSGNCTTSGGSNEEQIYAAVKALLSGEKVDNLTSLLKSNNNGPCCSAGQTGAKQIIPNARWQEILTILQNTEGFGNDVDEIDKYAVRCGKIYCEQVEKYTNARGGKFQAGMYPVSANVLYGKDVMALPTGHLAKTPIADGVSPRAGYDTHGPTAAANSVSKLDHALASNGTLYNMKFLPSALAGDKGIKNMASLIRSYFERKGMHVQFNVVDRNTLIDAQNHPDAHKDLVIRVAGYSAHFTKLAKETQDNIIARTEMEF
jgi:formate C-acetyltransferase